MPVCGNLDASATSNAILMMPNSPFSTGTQIALRSPVRTPSCRVKTPQMTTHTVKTSPADAPPSWAYDTPQ